MPGFNLFYANGALIQYKAPLVARGDTQKEGLDYVEIFAPTAKPERFRLLMSLIATLKLKSRP